MVWKIYITFHIMHKHSGGKLCALNGSRL